MSEPLDLPALDEAATLLDDETPSIGALAVMNYGKAGEVDIRAAAVMVVAFMIGGHFGSRIALAMDPLKVRLAFGTVMLFVAVRMIIQTSRELWTP